MTTIEAGPVAATRTAADPVAVTETGSETVKAGVGTEIVVTGTRSGCETGTGHEIGHGSMASMGTGSVVQTERLGSGDRNWNRIHSRNWNWYGDRDLREDWIWNRNWN